jgi:MFS family permease
MCYVGIMAAFQVPAGIFGERLGERILLAAGTVIAGAGFILLGYSETFGLLLLMLGIGGFGSSVQHPLGASIVASAYSPARRPIAIGIYNFAGDLGKVLVPTSAALALKRFLWPDVTITLGIVTIASAAAVLLAFGKTNSVGRPKPRAASTRSSGRGWGILDKRGFNLLSAVGIIDTATRYGCLTFLPFLLEEKGVSKASAGMALGLLFAGGAAGKFLSGLAAVRLGPIRTVLATEIVTSGGIFLVIVLPAWAAIAFFPVLGAALNGTSSVLYGSVASFVAPDRQARTYGLFYTIVILAGAASPPVYGRLADGVSLTAALIAVATVSLITVPLALLLRPSLAAHWRRA